MTHFEPRRETASAPQGDCFLACRGRRPLAYVSRMVRWLAWTLVVTMSFGCRPGASEGAATGPAHKGASKPKKYPARVHDKRAPAAIARPGQPMGLAEAQRYFLKLVNRDREAEGLEPVVWDAVAEKA